jgi:hypothetical protein
MSNLLWLWIVSIDADASGIKDIFYIHLNSLDNYQNIWKAICIGILSLLQARVLLLSMFANKWYYEWLQISICCCFLGINSWLREFWMKDRADETASDSFYKHAFNKLTEIWNNFL